MGKSPENDDLDEPDPGAVEVRAHRVGLAKALSLFPNDVSVALNSAATISAYHYRYDQGSAPSVND